MWSSDAFDAKGAPHRVHIGLARREEQMSAWQAPQNEEPAARTSFSHSGHAGGRRMFMMEPISVVSSLGIVSRLSRVFRVLKMTRYYIRRGFSIAAG